VRGGAYDEAQTGGADARRLAMFVRRILAMAEQEARFSTTKKLPYFILV
jgi:hypothetical protein